MCGIYVVFGSMDVVIGNVDLDVVIAYDGLFLSLSLWQSLLFWLLPLLVLVDVVILIVVVEVVPLLIPW